MKAARFLPHVLVVGLLLALAGSAGLGLAQAPASSGEVQLQGEASIAATVATKFSYQGVLKENGSPVTGSRNMVFRLFSDDTCSTQVGSEIVKTGVQVTNGLFDVDLDVLHTDFDGQGLWLQVVVGGTAIGCQEILPVPYALSLRPGARINDTTTDVGLNHLDYPYKSGVHAEAEGAGPGISYRGLYGSGTDFGVYGHSDSGAAVYGSGDVKQNREGDGLVKAAVLVNCNNDLLLGCARDFNNVNSETIICSAGPSNGRCTIDFGFQISDRFWVATAVGGYGYGVTCDLGSTTEQLDCVRWSGADGTGLDGLIMVLVY